MSVVKQHINTEVRRKRVDNKFKVARPGKVVKKKLSDEVLNIQTVWNCENLHSLRKFLGRKNKEEKLIKLKLSMWDKALGFKGFVTEDSVEVTGYAEPCLFTLGSIKAYYPNDKVVYVHKSDVRTQMLNTLLTKYKHLLTSDLEVNSVVYQPYPNATEMVENLKECGADFEFFTLYCNENIINKKDAHQYTEYYRDVMTHCTIKNLRDYGYTPIQATNIIKKVFSGSSKRKGKMITPKKVLWDYDDEATSIESVDLIKACKAVIYNTLKSCSEAVEFCRKLKEENTLDEDLLPKLKTKRYVVTLNKSEGLVRSMVATYTHQLEMNERFSIYNNQTQDLLRNFIEKTVVLV